MLPITTGIPEHKVRVVAPSVGGGFGSKLNVYAEEVLAVIARPRSCGGPVRWTETRSEAASSPPSRDAARSRHRARGRRRRSQVTAVRVEAAGRHGCLPPARHARASRCSARSSTTASTTSRRTRSAARGCSPTSRPPTRTAVRDGRRPPTRSSAPWTLLAREIGHRPRRDPAPQLHPADAFPYRRRRRPRASTAATTSRPSTARSSCVELRRAAGRAGTPPRRRRPTHLGIGIATYVEMCGLAPSRVLASLRYAAGGLGVRHRAHPAHLQGAGRHRHVAARPGPRDLLVDDRGRPARHRAPTTSRCCTATPRSVPRTGHLRVAIAGRSVAPPCALPPTACRRQGRHRRPHAGGSPRTISKLVDGSFRVKGTPTTCRGPRGRGDCRVHRPRPARRHRAQPRGPGHVGPAQLHVPVRHPRRGRRGRRDTATSGSSTTSPSTTAGTRSTR